jgi:hypothetical protein
MPVIAAILILLLLAAFLLAVLRGGILFGLSLLVSQATIWVLVVFKFIANPKIPDNIAFIGIATPLIVSVIAWRLAYRGWGWRVDSVRPDAPRLRKRRRICVTSAIAFVFLHLLMSGNLRNAAIVGKNEATRSEALNIALEAGMVALDHCPNFPYPDSLSDIPRIHQVNGWEAGSDGVHHPMMEGLDDKTIADLGQYAYFGKGLTTKSAPDIVVIESKTILPGGAHVLVTIDDTTFWVGPIGYTRIQHFLEQHIPRTQWKD